MFNHILVSTDVLEVAQKGVDHGLSLAASLNARVTVIIQRNRFQSTCMPELPTPMFPGRPKWWPVQAKQLKVLAAVKVAAKKLRVSADTIHVPDDPAETIVGPRFVSAV